MAGRDIPPTPIKQLQANRVHVITQVIRILALHRTHRAKIRNHAPVADSLDWHRWSANKLWNAANYHSRHVWEAAGKIPDHGDRKARIGVPAGWHSSESTCTTSPEVGILGKRWLDCKPYYSTPAVRYRSIPASSDAGGCQSPTSGATSHRADEVSAKAGISHRV